MTLYEEKLEVDDPELWGHFADEAEPEPAIVQDPAGARNLPVPALKNLPCTLKMPTG